jgi:hypothetical protein
MTQDVDLVDRTARRMADEFCGPFLEELNALRPSDSFPAGKIRELQTKVLRLCAERLNFAADESKPEVMVKKEPGAR